MSVVEAVDAERAQIIAELEDIAQHFGHGAMPMQDPTVATRWRLTIELRHARGFRLGLDTNRHPDLLARYLIESAWGRAVGATVADAPGLAELLADAYAEGLTTTDEIRRARIADRVLGSDWFRGVEARHA